MSERMELNRLDWIRAEHAEAIQKTTWPAEPNHYREDIGYLLHIIGLLEQQVEAQIIAKLDPDNEPEHHHVWTRTGGGLAPGHWLCRTCPAEGTWDGDDNTPIQETK